MIDKQNRDGDADKRTKAMHDSIRIELAKYIHQSTPAAIAGLLLGITAVTLTYRSTAPFGVSIWIRLALPLLVVRIIFWYFHKNNIIDITKANLVIRWNTALATSVSCVGASGAVFMLPYGTTSQQFIFVCTLVFHNLATVFSLGVIGWSYALAVMPFALGILGVIVTGRWNFDPVFIFVYLAFFVTAFLFAMRFRSVFLNSLHLRYENLGLIAGLTLQKEEAEDANAAKSRFLAAASHDLRQPMHALEMYLMTASQNNTSPGMAQVLNNAHRCAQTMNDMFGVLLDMSRLDAGTLVPHMEQFALTDVLSRLQLEFQPLMNAKGLQFKVAGKRLSQQLIYSDPVILERILRNLLSNALRYTPSGRVVLGVRKSPHGLRIFVADTGIGIPQELREQVFEEFFQAGNPERDRNKGLGLGLAIVRRLVRVLNCHLDLYSNGVHGTTFCLTLAANVIGFQANSEHSFAAFETDVVREPQGLGKCIWVIDDEKEIRTATTIWLQSQGYVVYAEDNAQNILHALNGQFPPAKPDLLVCDYRLRHGVSGIDAAKSITTTLGRDIPLVLITGDTGPAAMRDFERHGCKVLHKPLSPTVLLTEVETNLQHAVGLESHLGTEPT